MKKMQQGFTLIELMIVVAIIGILAAIAIPAYSDYVTRAKWSDTISNVASVKTAIGECVDNNGGIADNTGALNTAALALCDTVAELDEYGVPSTIGTTKYGAVVTVVATTAAISMNGSSSTELANCSFSLTPGIGAGGISVLWTPIASSSACVKYVKESDVAPAPPASAT